MSHIDADNTLVETMGKIAQDYTIPAVHKKSIFTHAKDECKHPATRELLDDFLKINDEKIAFEEAREQAIAIRRRKFLTGNKP